MATSSLVAQEQDAPSPNDGAERIVNDFSIQIATVNGSGSQSANNVLLRSIFRMGVPVSGKNLFPSNIAGLPTWYTIRVSKYGWVARKTEIDLLIAMNPETAQEDVRSLSAGAAVIYDDSITLSELRADLTYYPVPFDKLAAATGAEAKLRKLIKNMVYVGVAAQLLSIDMEWVENMVRKQFAKKLKAAELNWTAVQTGFEYASSSLTKQDPFVVEPMNETEGKIIIDGNAALRMGAMFAGVTVVAWYPITPSSSVVENLIDYMKKYRVEQDGKASFAIVQAEDELAAIGMVLGAGWAGARSMTASSGPGISLMAEFAGLGYYAEIPGVIFDIQRTGPSTGLPTRTSQADLAFVAGLSHGDTKHVMLLPGSVKECFEFGDRGIRSRRAAADAGVCALRSRPGHEQLDVRAVRVSREADAIAARCWTRSNWKSWAASPATRMWMATEFRTARCRVPTILRPHTSRAAPATTRRRSTPSGRTITRTTCCGWRGSSRPRKRMVPKPIIEGNGQ